MCTHTRTHTVSSRARSLRNRRGHRFPSRAVRTRLRRSQHSRGATSRLSPVGPLWRPSRCRRRRRFRRRRLIWPLRHPVVNGSDAPPPRRSPEGGGHSDVYSWYTPFEIGKHQSCTLLVVLQHLSRWAGGRVRTAIARLAFKGCFSARALALR